MTRLLISVRSPEECAIAITSAVDVIDIKEPTRGSLGAADPDVIRSIVTMTAGRRPVSVALGELLDFDAERYAALPSVDYVKLGLAGCAHQANWQAAWQTAWHSLPGAARRVAVAYADAARAQSPPWTEVLAAARDNDCSVLLVDTYDKTGGGLVDWLDLSQLARLRRDTRRVEIELALAGSLTSPQIVSLLHLEPDFVAVRAAVCPGGRGARLSRPNIDSIAADLVGAME